MADIKLVIGNKNYSSWSLRAWFMLKEFNIPFEEIRIPLGTDEFYQNIKTYSPAAKVPAVSDGAIKIWDSLSICEYISENYLSGKGWPEDRESRAMARSISAEMHSGFEGVRSQLPINCRALRKNYPMSEQTQNEIKRIQSIWTQCFSMNKEGNWLFGEFSIADAMYAPVVSRFHTYQIELDETASKYSSFVMSNPNIKEWFATSSQEGETIDIAEVGDDIGFL